MKKRQDYISWDEYFMGVALLSAKRSKDPSTQVGACIVSDKNKIVGAGYNGLPMGCDDDDFPWEKQGAFLDTKYSPGWSWAPAGGHWPQMRCVPACARGLSALTAVP